MVLIKTGSLIFETKSFYGNSEKVILNNCLYYLQGIKKDRITFAGHNIKEFDIPFLCRRMLINKIALPDYLNFQHVKPWEQKTFDTFQFWRFGDYKNFTSLKLLAKILKVPGSKEGMDGSIVGPLYWESDPIKKELNLIKIADYCLKDVVTTANIILRICNKELLSDHDIKTINSN